VISLCWNIQPHKSSSDRLKSNTVEQEKYYKKKKQMIRARYFRRRKVASCVDKRISRLVIEISLLLDNKTFSSSYLYCLTKLTIPYMYYIRGLGYFVLIICNEFIVLCCEESSAFQPFPTRKFALIYDCFRIRASL